MTNYRRTAGLFAFLLLLISAPALLAQNIKTCSSNDMKRHFCNMGPFRDARLVNQRSGSPCVRGQTWGIQGNSIWVDRGCRADFQLMNGGPGRYPGGRSQGVRCSSGNMNHVRCPVNGQIARVEMARQISGSACIQGRTWGYDRNSLWVDRGCRADFTVWFR